MLAIAVPLISINMEKKDSKKPFFSQPFIFVSGLVQSAYSSFSSGVHSTTSLYLNLVDIKKDNRELKKVNNELRAQLGALTELKLENERLSQLLHFEQKTNMKLLAAKVIGKDIIPDHNTLIINRGRIQGVHENMAVITTGGVVGYVINAQPYTSQILLLTDRYAAIDSIVQRSRARGITEGYLDNCRLSYLRRDDDIKTGDLIVTSGLDNIYPKGFPVGVVKDIEFNKYDITPRVTIDPIVDPFSLEEVFIVLNANNEDFEKLKESEKSKENEELKNNSESKHHINMNKDSKEKVEKNQSLKLDSLQKTKSKTKKAL